MGGFRNICGTPQIVKPPQCNPIDGCWTGCLMVTLWTKTWCLMILDGDFPLVRIMVNQQLIYVLWLVSNGDEWLWGHATLSGWYRTVHWDCLLDGDLTRVLHPFLDSVILQVGAWLVFVESITRNQKVNQMLCDHETSTKKEWISPRRNWSWLKKTHIANQPNLNKNWQLSPATDWDWQVGPLTKNLFWIWPGISWRPQMHGLIRIFLVKPRPSYV